MVRDEYTISVEFLRRFTAGEVWEYYLLPYREDQEQLYCYGVKERDYGKAVTELEIIHGKPIHIDWIDKEILEELINRHYRLGESASSVEKRTITPGTPGFIQSLIREARAENASDIHFEPYEERCRVRLRIDGKLIEQYAIEKTLYAAVVNQIKIMAGLDISERRLPQDGRIFYKQDGNPFDLRVSTLPTIYGEKVVLRLLTRQLNLLDLDNLGFSGKQIADYRRAIQKPHGLILISGPTGSGKSTTLYATLRELNRTNCNILTIEDPVEYTLEGVNQVQLKEEIGLGFAEALRTFLRQDPDIIMLGEIRDKETAQMAVRSSLTGHLILSTIHTNSAWGCVPRLADMGIHPFLLADTLVLCMAQRLVRLLCPHCKKKIPGSDLPAFLKVAGEEAGGYYGPVGCKQCYFTGYKGRRALYEVIPLTEELSGCVRRAEADVSLQLRTSKVTTLREAALGLLRDGLTSPEEILPLLDNN